MPFPERRSARLTRFDYASPGAYFVTVVVHQRRCLLGDVVAGSLIPTDAGRLVFEIWHRLACRYPDITLDAFVAMPNRVHGILRLDRAARQRQPFPVPAVVGAFKSLTTNAYSHGVKTYGWPSFDRHLWQRSYYDRVIRDDAELAAYREYIATNPLRWSLDREFPRAAPEGR